MEYYQIIELMQNEIEKDKRIILDTKTITSFDEYRFRLGFLQGFTKAVNMLINYNKRNND